MWAELLVLFACASSGPSPTQPTHEVAAPTPAQLAAKVTETVELSPAGSAAAEATLLGWHRRHGIGDELAALGRESGLSYAARGRVALLLADWGDPHASAVIRALADDGDPTLMEAAFAAALRLPPAERAALIEA